MSTLTDLATQLETLVDSHGLATVCDALAGVCADKAQHLIENWQDSTSARHWSAAHLDLDRLAQRQRRRTGERS